MCFIYRLLDTEPPLPRETDPLLRDTEPLLRDTELLPVE